MREHRRARADGEIGELARPDLDSDLRDALLQLGQLGFGGLSRAVGEDDDELVAGVADAEVVRAQRTLQGERDFAQRVIADMMPVVVVDALERVDVHHDQRDLALQALGARELARQVDEHRAAVRERRQRIGQRIFLRLLEHDRVVDHGARLLRDPLEQPAMIFRVPVRLRMIERQASDEGVVEMQRAHDRRPQIDRTREAERLERHARIGVDERAAVARDPSCEAMTEPQRGVQQLRRVGPCREAALQ